MSRLLLMVLLFSSHMVKAQVSKEAEAKEDRAYEALEALPEIQNLVKNDTGKVWHLTMRTIRIPGDKFKYYWIEVGQTNGQRMVSQFHFYVKPPKMDVFYMDPMTDSLFTPAQWRARGR